MRIRMQRPMVRSANLAIARTSPKQTVQHYGTPEHKQWREAVIARAGGRCQGAGPHSNGALIADHKIELRDGGKPLDLDNGQALCPKCHGRKTHAERARRQRGERRA